MKSVASRSVKRAHCSQNLVFFPSLEMDNPNCEVVFSPWSTPSHVAPLIEAIAPT